MTMYLPNNDLQPTGSEITEFIDVPPMAETPPRPTAPSSDEKEPPCDSTRRPSSTSPAATAPGSERDRKDPVAEDPQDVAVPGSLCRGGAGDLEYLDTSQVQPGTVT